MALKEPSTNRKYSLRPDECVQKILISTPSRFIGELEVENLLLTHAWEGMHKRNMGGRYSEGPASRSAYVLVVRTEPQQRTAGSVLQDYSALGPLICGYLSVLFGKRFDNHGLLEGVGHSYIPDQSQFLTLTNPQLPHNSYKRRKNLEIPLDLSKAEVLLPLLFGQVSNEKVVRAFQTASHFYSQALHNRDDNPEIAYLHLISAMEIISGFYNFDDSQLIDEQMRQYFMQIESEMINGKKIARAIRATMHNVKRKVLLTAQLMLDSRFYDTHEAQSDLFALQMCDRDKNIKAAYDLRSRYVHTGTPFGSWIISGSQEEVQVGKPMVEKEYAKILHHAPKFLGLERMVRYCLLRFLHLNGVPIHPSLDEVTAITS